MSNLKNPFIASERSTADRYILMPDMARFLSGHYNDENVRPINKAEVKKFARAIRAGLWEDNGARLIFEKDTGKCVDGGTRLAAVVLANMPIVVDVLYGIPKPRNLDTQRRRATSVLFAIDLGGKPDQYTQITPMTKIWLRFENNWKVNRFPIQEMIAFYVKNKVAIDSMVGAVGNAYTNRAGFRAACAFYATKNPDKAQKFFEMVANGSEFKTGSPTIALHSHLLATHKTQHPETQLKSDFEHTLAMCHAFEHNEKVLAIRKMSVWK